MTKSNSSETDFALALATAERLLGGSLLPFLEPGEGEPENAKDFKRIATMHAFGDSWSRTHTLGDRSRALVSVAATATLGTREPLRGQLRIALNAGVAPEEIVELFIHLAAYTGVARAFESYSVAREVFAERAAATSGDTVDSP